MREMLEGRCAYLTMAIRTWTPFDDGPSRHEMREERAKIQNYVVDTVSAGRPG